MLAERPTGRQTGPKGVLADYAQHRQIERERQAADRIAQQSKFTRYASPTTAATTSPKTGQKTTTNNNDNNEPDKEDELLRELMEELELEDFEQDEALRSYREMRIREMKTAR